MKKNLCLVYLVIFACALTAQTPRLSLYEEFTGENCLPCAGANPGLNALLALPTNTAKCVAIKWQVPIPSAPSTAWSLYQTNKTEIDWRYKSTAAGGYGYNISSAPTGKMDGQNVTLFGAASDSPSSLTSNVISTAQSFTSAFNINITRDWDATCTAVNLTISIQATANFVAVGNLIFRTVMVENLIQFPSPPGSNGETDFEDVAVKSFPTLQSGVPMAGTWTIGQTQTFTLNCSIPSYIRKKSEIAFVGFIQDDGNKKVAQACRSVKQALPSDAEATAQKQNVVCSNTFIPQLTVKNKGLSAITAMTITPYVDGASGNAHIWTGSLAPSGIVTFTLTTFNTPATVGAHSFSFTIDAINTTDFDLTNNSANVSFAVASSYQGTPVVEGFVATTFPPLSFTSVNPNGGPAWSRVNSSGIGGYGLSPESAKYNFYSNTVIGDQDEFILPPVDLTGNTTPYMLFDVAYAQRTTTSNDKLEVFVSDNCGSNWTNVYGKSGQTLSNIAPYDGSEYFPGSSEWRTEIISLAGFNSSSLLVKFVTTNDNGNNLYLDNINLSLESPLGIKENNIRFEISIFPNPAKDKASIAISTNVSGPVKITLIDMLGRCVYENPTTLTSGTNHITLNVNEFTSGVYTLAISSENNTVVKKLIVN